jgi:adenylosuccinate lyase
MISRYSLPEMTEIWSEESKWSALMNVEIAVARAQSDLGLIPKTAFKEISQKAKFNIKRIKEIEETTKHDIIAFVSCLAENVGDSGKYIHYGLTSSDVLDTGLALQVKLGGEELLAKVDKLSDTLISMIQKHWDTLCVGRTHGIHAEPTTFGFKLCGFYEELKRNKERLVKAVDQACVGQLSGAVGTHSFLGPEVESMVCKDLGLKIEPIATQVTPRDRYAELFNAIAMMGTFIERLSVELRHLQRTEVSEVIEGFSKGQKGSSAMPHKKNPISAENLTGAARLLRSYAQAAMENVALWHERDISHSSVERVIFPDAFILLDYALNRMNRVLSGLFVDKERMLKNLNSLGGQIYSSHLLLDLVDAGLKREDAYKVVQSLAHNLSEGELYEDKVKSSEDVLKYVPIKDLNMLFSGKRHTKNIKKRINQSLPKGKKIK